MTQKSNSGYQGKVLDIIKKTGCTVGDIILVEKEEKIFEGTLIPRSEYGEEQHTWLWIRMTRTSICLHVRARWQRF